MKNYSEKILGSVMGVIVLTATGFSQGRQHKCIRVGGEIVCGTPDGGIVSRPGPIPRKDLLDPDQFLSVSASDPGKWSPVLAGEFSVGSGSMNSYSVGFVRQGQKYKLEAIGLQGFNPVIVAFQVRPAANADPISLIASARDCDNIVQDNEHPRACVEFEANSDDLLLIFVGGADFREGRYRLYVSVNQIPDAQ